MTKKNSNKLVFLKLLRFLCISWTIIVILSIIYWFGLLGSIAISLKMPLFLFEGYVSFLVLMYLISWIIIVFVIKDTKQNKKPITISYKIFLFLFPWGFSAALYMPFKKFGRWYGPLTRAKTSNECFNHYKFEYLPNPIATQECKSKRFKYLQTKFNNVQVVVINWYHERYRVGSMEENAILGIDYLLFEKNPRYYDPIESFLDRNDVFPQICYFSLNNDETPASRKFFYKVQDFCGWFNILGKIFWTFKGMIFWINKNFPQFNKIK